MEDINNKHLADDRKYKCEVCDKSFKTKGHVKRHMMVHTGIKPFQCVICEKHLSRNSDLKKTYDGSYGRETLQV